MKRCICIKKLETGDARDRAFEVGVEYEYNYKVGEYSVVEYDPWSWSFSNREFNSYFIDIKKYRKEKLNNLKIISQL